MSREVDPGDCCDDANWLVVPLRPAKMKLDLQGYANAFRVETPLAEVE